jgi:hypothetical protein
MNQLPPPLACVCVVVCDGEDEDVVCSPLGATLVSTHASLP